MTRVLVLVTLLGLVVARGGAVQEEPDLALASGRDLERRAQHALRDGRIGDACDLFIEALASYEEAGDTGSVHVCATNASFLATRLGRYRSARDLATRAVELARELDPALEARSRTNLGLALRYLNLLDEAAAEYGRVLEIHGSLDNPEGMARNLSNLAAVDLHRGRYRAALASCREALQLCEDHPEESWSAPERRSATVNQASVLELIGQAETSFGLYASLLSEPDLAEEERAFILTGAGRVHLKLGNASESRRLLEEARLILDAMGDRGSLANVLQHLGVLLCERFEDHAGARTFLREALTMAQDLEDRQEVLYDLLHLGRCLLHTGDHEASEVFTSARELASELSSPEGAWIARYGLGRCSDLADDAQEAMDHYLASLDIIDEMRRGDVPERFRASFLGDTGFFWEKMEVIGAAVSHLLRQDRGEPETRVAAAFDVVERFSGRSLLDHLGAHPLSLEKLRTILGERETVLHLLPDGRKIVALVISRTVVQGVILDCPDAVHEEVRKLVSGSLHGGQLASGVGGGAITDFIVSPVLDSLPPDTRQLLIVTATSLASLPWPFVEDPTGRPLQERFEIAVIPSASLLETLRRTGDRGHGMDLLGVGDPILVSGEQETVGSATSERELLEKKYALQPLAWSRDELRLVASRIGGTHQLLVGPEATVPAFLTGVTRAPRIVHLATHTVVDVALPGVATIVLSPDVSTDGLLWEGEIADLEIPADLVVLATCRSAGGLVIRGEGVIGLARAFLGAGARSVVCALSDVGDRASASFMSAFYTELTSGKTAGEALSRAHALAAAQTRSTVRAHFVIVGDPSVRIATRRSSLGRLLVSLGAGIVVFVGLVVLIRRRRVA